jgi:FtsH-binding integral membrane protein
LIKEKKILILEVIGTLFIIFLGTALHFTFAASGDNPVVGSVSAVNESVWEHLKLPFWPSIFWLLIIMYPLRNTVSNFFSAKAVGIVLMVIIIPVVFYTYTAFTKENLAIDIATFMIAVIVGQIVSVILYRKTSRSRITEAVAIAVLVLLATMFLAFTFYPPHLPIFLDSESGKYGI